MSEVTMKRYVKYLRHNKPPHTQTVLITHTERHQSQNIYILQMKDANIHSTDLLSTVSEKQKTPYVDKNSTRQQTLEQVLCYYISSINHKGGRSKLYLTNQPITKTIRTHNEILP